MNLVFTSGRKYEHLRTWILRCGDFIKIVSHLIGPRVPTQNWGLKLGYALF